MTKQKTKTLKAILINPDDCSIREVLIKDTQETFKDIQRMLNCEFFECVRINAANTLYIDDSGLVNGTTTFFPFNHPSALPPPTDNAVINLLLRQGHFRGRGLILGTTPSGASASTTLSAEFVDEQNSISLVWGRIGSNFADIS